MSEFASEGSQAAEEEAEHIQSEPLESDQAEPTTADAGETEDVPDVQEH